MVVERAAHAPRHLQPVVQAVFDPSSVQSFGTRGHDNNLSSIFPPYSAGLISFIFTLSLDLTALDPYGDQNSTFKLLLSFWLKNQKPISSYVSKKVEFSNFP